MTVRVVKLLCQRRHTMLAVTYRAPDGAADPEMGTALLDLFRQRYPRGCPFCSSEYSKTEDSATEFGSIAEAKPELERKQAEQSASSVREFMRTRRATGSR